MHRDGVWSDNLIRMIQLIDKTGMLIEMVKSHHSHIKGLVTNSDSVEAEENMLINHIEKLDSKARFFDEVDRIMIESHNHYKDYPDNNTKPELIRIMFAKKTAELFLNIKKNGGIENYE